MSALRGAGHGFHSRSITISDTAHHPRCPACDYDLYGLDGDPVCCPECGRSSFRRELNPPKPARWLTLKDVLLAPVAVGAGWLSIAALVWFPNAFSGIWWGVVIGAGLAGIFGALRPRLWWLFATLLVMGQFAAIVWFGMQSRLSTPTHDLAFGVVLLRWLTIYYLCAIVAAWKGAGAAQRT